MSDTRPSGETSLQPLLPVAEPDHEREIRVQEFARELIIDAMRLPPASLVITDTMKEVVREAAHREEEQFLRALYGDRSWNSESGTSTTTRTGSH